MKFLYFTRSNGDIDNMPNRESLKTSVSRKAFIGDEVFRFSVQDAVLCPVWDGSKYIKNVTNKEEGRKAAKQIRDEALHNCTVELNGNVFQTRPSDESNFRLSIAGMEDGGKEEWILANNTIVEVTKADLEQVYVLGLKEVSAIYATYKEALKAL